VTNKRFIDYKSLKVHPCVDEGAPPLEVPPPLGLLQRFSELIRPSLAQGRSGPGWAEVDDAWHRDAAAVPASRAQPAEAPVREAKPPKAEGGEPQVHEAGATPTPEARQRLPEPHDPAKVRWGLRDARSLDAPAHLPGPPAERAGNAPLPKHPKDDEATDVTAREVSAPGDVEQPVPPSPGRGRIAKTPAPQAVDDAFENQIAVASAPPPLVESLAERKAAENIATSVVRFCNESTEQASEGLQVSIALREDVMPGTTLNLTLSRHWLLLRFDCVNLQSRQLLSKHQQLLEASIDRALVPRREVSITME
jgi:hypothetical protein